MPDPHEPSPPAAGRGAEAAASPTPALSLLDGARAEQTALPAETEAWREVAADPAQPLDERLAAFEDILDSQVGDTGMVRARNVEREFGLRQLYLKFEGGNPTGTQKDRIAFAQVQDALRRGFDGVTLATCGNYGASVALAASQAGLRCEIFIPDGYHTDRLPEMERAGAEIILSPGDYEAAVDRSRERATARDLYDANPGGANTHLQLLAYGEIAFEIYDELRDAPAAVAVPVSNGTTLAGIHKGFVRLYRRGKTSRIPHFVAGSSPWKNPIVRSYLKNLPGCEDLDPAKVRESRVNEPLINWHSFDGDEALAAIRSSGGWADSTSDREMQAHARRLRDREGLSVLPASTAGLAVLLDHARKDGLPPDRYVAVLTGRR